MKKKGISPLADFARESPLGARKEWEEEKGWKIGRIFWKGGKGVGKDILTMFNEWLDADWKVTAIHLTNEQFVYGLLITVLWTPM